MKPHKKKTQGAELMASASRIWKFVKSDLLRGYDVDLREYDVDLLGPPFDFLRFFTASFELRAVDRSVFSATFRQDLLLHLLNPYHIISAVTALQAAAQLEDVYLIFCVLRDEHLSIDRPVCPLFAWPASSCCCWLRLLYR